MSRRGWMFVVAALALLVSLPASLEAQRRGYRRPVRNYDYDELNVKYDGRFTFLRLRYLEGFGGGGYSGGDPGWRHDWPTAEQHFGQILKEITLVDAHLDGGAIYTLDRPEIFSYPLAYLSEPGYWDMNAAELDGFRSYILKGGFLIVDDFRGVNQWWQFEQQMTLAFPDLRPIRLTAEHPIFNAFFAIESLDGFYHPYGAPGPAEFYGYFEGNDPTRRMYAIANYNNDIGDYWEFSDTGWIPIDLSNEAYKLGVNYLVYSMTR